MNKIGKRKIEQPRLKLFPWIVLFLGGVVLLIFLGEQRREATELSYSQFLRELEGGNIKEIAISERDLSGSFKNPLSVKNTPIKYFKSRIPFDDPNLANALVRAGVEVTVKKRQIWWDIVWGYLPWFLIFFIFWFFLMRQFQGGPNRVFTFGKSRVKTITEDRPKTTFNEVAGVDEAKEELKELIQFLKEPTKFTKIGARIPKGVLLLGPPGSGKTLLARAVAGEAGAPFLSISGSDFVELFVGVGAARVRDLFEQAKSNAPCIVFIDEIDAVGRLRGAGLGGGHDEREQTLNQLLVEMDGFDTTQGIVIMAATNRPDILDPALLRPGRFDRQIVVDSPDVRGREAILKIHSRKIPLAPDVNLTDIARATPGFSGADLANLVNEAALLAARAGREKVGAEDMEEAKDKVLMGVARKSMVLSEEEKKKIAYHESGHALVSRFLSNTDPVHKVTIIPRGRSLGITQQLPVDDRHIYAKDYLKSQLTVLLGGRSSERVMLNEETTGAGNDLERATELARKMVCEWGMSERLGPVTFGKVEEEVFLGRELGIKRNYSEETALTIDAEIKRLVGEAEAKACELIKANQDKLHLLAQTLLEKETLEGEEIDTILGIKKK